VSATLALVIACAHISALSERANACAMSVPQGCQETDAVFVPVLDYEANLAFLVLRNLP
jgi:hypothetical protein